MKNYYKFTKLLNDNESINFYNSLSNIMLNNHLDDLFNDIDNYLNYYAIFFKEIFNGQDYDEHYYDMKALLEELNDIKIILNILNERKR